MQFLGVEEASYNGLEEHSKERRGNWYVVGFTVEQAVKQLNVQVNLFSDTYGRILAFRIQGQASR